MAKEPHVAEPQEASNGEDTSPERHHGSSRHEQDRSVERSLPHGDGHHRPANSDAWHLRPAARRSVGDSRKVELFDAFTADNDPHQERDFGSFDHAGQTIFWKIDYYDPTLTCGSEDPSDPRQTVRVLTVMLAAEY